MSGINKSASICSFTPRPLQSGQAPYGALKLKILGSNSGRENSQYGQANASDNTSSFLFSPNISTTTLPSDSLVAPSIASNSLDLEPSLMINLSITTSILCFLFLSSMISSDKSIISPSTRTLTYPSLRKSSSKSFCVPFSPCTTGDMMIIFVPSGYSKTLFVISSTL